jgi:hypothetical protein
MSLGKILIMMSIKQPREHLQLSTSLVAGSKFRMGRRDDDALGLEIWVASWIDGTVTWLR